MECLFVDHDCLSLPPPDPLNNATCREPTETVAKLEDEMLNGLWYVVRGFNPLYDCFQCQKLTFEIKDGQVDYYALFNMAAVNGTQIWPLAHMTGDDYSKPGTVSLVGSENGLPDQQDWYVMLLTEDTMVAYYCGDILDQWHFEGLLVMSRTQTLNPEREADVSLILEDLGIKESQICIPDPASACQSAPSEQFTQ